MVPLPYIQACRSRRFRTTKCKERTVIVLQDSGALWRSLMELQVNSQPRQLQPSRIASYPVASALKTARRCVAATEPSRRQERLDTSIRNKWTSGDPKGLQKPLVDRSTRRLANQTTAKSVVASLDVKISGSELSLVVEPLGSVVAIFQIR